MVKDKLTEVLAWAMKVLNQTKINATVVVETPWSNVLKIITPQGIVYLKQTPPGPKCSAFLLC